MAEGRFHLVNTPVLAPGTCFISGSTGPAVDTGQTVRWTPANAPRDRIYLSIDVIRELADVAGVREVTSMNENLAAAQEYNRGYMDAVKERVGDQLVELVDRLGLLSALLAGSDDADPAGAEGSEPGAVEAGLDGDGAGSADDGERGPSGRPRSKQRRADVLGNPGAGAA